MLAGRGALRLQAAPAERLPDLLVQIYAIGDQHDLLVEDGKILGDRGSEHDHRERLSAALRVPDDTAQPPPLRVGVPYPLHHVPHTEVLLIPRDLFLARVVEREPVHQFQQALRPAQSEERPILFGRLSVRLLQFLEMPTNVMEA